MTDNTINNDMTMGGAGGNLLAGRYRVVRQLGQGGMGSVWLAEDTTLDNRQVAIKMLPSILLSNPRAYEQLKREALVALKLSHTNIAPIRSFEENGGNPFLVEDYIHGMTLDRCLAEWGDLSTEEVVALLAPIADAIDYAHREGVVHRDIKPSNIMIRDDGVPFVLDFGVAREIQEGMTRVTGQGTSGTLMYMSPEQLKGSAPSPAQDVYSFAAMAYECLCGHPPFHRGQVEYQIVNEMPERLSGESAVIDGVMAGLAKRPQDRPHACMDILLPYGEPSVSPSVQEQDGESEKPVHANVGLPSAIGLKRWAYVAGVTILLLGFGVTVRSSRTDRTVEALAAFEAGDFDTGLRLASDIPDGNPVIQYWIGNCYCEGLGGVSSNFVEAVKWWRKSAERGYAPAQEFLGTCYNNGDGVAEDPSEAVKWFIMAAEQGDADAAFWLADCYESGRGAARDYVEAARWRMMAAEQQHAGAQVKLGISYYNGEGVDKNYVEAVRWFREAANHGSAYAEYLLGVCYQNGRGVTQNDDEAGTWYRRAAEHGDVEAQFTMGCRMSELARERQVAGVDAQAMEWYLKAAEQGHDIAMVNLANCYKRGDGVVRNPVKAVEWYRKSAEQGNLIAQFELGDCYFRGDGIACDPVEAVKWFRSSAVQGYPVAQCRLGLCYKFGEGVEKDLGEAKMWFSKAAELGNYNAQEELMKLEAQDVDGTVEVERVAHEKAEAES